MPRTLLLVGVLAVLTGCTGCSGCNRSRAVPMPPAPQFVTMPPVQPVDSVVEPEMPTYQTRTVAQWADLLRDPRSRADQRFQAIRAMETFGRESGSYLLEAMKTGQTAEVRLAAMEALTPAAMAGRDKEFVPVLMDLLKDRNPLVRQQAAGRLCWFDRSGGKRPEPGYMAQERLWALQASYHFDSDPGVRLASRNSLLSIYDHMRREEGCPPVQDIFIDRPPQ